MFDCFNCLKRQSADIRQLNYQHSNLNDVPAEVFAYERTLEELFLDSNRIRDLPRPLFHCHGLKVLSLSDNEVLSLPPAIASLINLQYLDVSRNALNGIPDNLKGCKHLFYVDVSVNPLEKLPEGFTQLICLEELYLNDTCLDFLPANFGRLMKLKILELRENNLNTLPKSIARLTHLQRLDIGQNDFSDLPEVIGSLVNLNELWMDSNRIKCIPTFIGNLKKLVHLEASDNNIRWIASEIGQCSKLFDLTLTCNELRELPESIGKLKELVTLKLDDNQISHLPNSIGKLSNLEELVLSQNDLECLNPCIGLLRKLYVLNVDDNMLEELPPEIGSCSSLAILSAHSNKLQYVPAELGHLTNLRVVNFSENHLRSLPVSVLNLVNLTALWLSNNQSTPLTTLQQEVDAETGQTVCVNFMLPQSSQKHNFYDDRHGKCTQSEATPAKTKQHITFATENDVEAPSRLMRAPTPYPKELRAMAKHARSIHHPKKLTKESDEDTPLLGEMVSQEPKDVLIKEAKVKKPATASTDESVISSEKNGEASESDAKAYSYGEEAGPKCERMFTPCSSGDDGSPVVATDSGPVVREAKCIRKLSNLLPTSVEGKQRQSVASNSEQSVLQPPPYHIAAAYSKQAMFFRQAESQNQRPNIYEEKPANIIYHKNEEESAVHVFSEEKAPHVIYYGREGFENSKKRCDSLKSDSRIEEVELSLAAANGNEIRDENYENVLPSKQRSKPKDIYPKSVISSPRILEESISFSSSGHRTGDRSISNRLVSSPSSYENSRTNTDDVLQFSLSPDSQINDESDVVETTTDKSCSRLEVNESSEGYDPNQETQYHNSYDQHEKELEKENITMILLQRLQAFTQDKPIASEGVIAPTPHRPGSPNTPSSPLIDSIGFLSSTPVSSLPSQNNSPRKPSGIPKAISRTSPISPDLFINSKDKPNKNICHSPISTRIPQPVFYSNATSSHASSRRSSISSGPSTFELSSSISEGASFSIKGIPIPAHFPCSKEYYKAKENECMESCSDNNYGSDKSHFHLSLSSEPGNECDSSVVSEKSQDSSRPGHSNFSTKSLTSPSRAVQSSSVSRIPAPTKLSSPASHLNQKARLDMQGKHTKAWFFGPHRNPTVFPVIIQKNPGLGFSISGGSKLSASDKHESGIFVTKVHPSGAASGLLLPGDKILEVEGTDFTKLDHDQAVEVLRSTSNSVHMMISRQQT